jgi:hypothetical protein
MNDPWINEISLRLWAPPSTSTPAGIGAKGPEREEGERGKGRGRGQEYQIYEEWRDETLVGVPATEGAHFSRINTWTKSLTAGLHNTQPEKLYHSYRYTNMKSLCLRF